MMISYDDISADNEMICYPIRCYLEVVTVESMERNIIHGVIHCINGACGSYVWNI
jgi:hypothetical protein